jgi:hypothetical protein
MSRRLRSLRLYSSLRKRSRLSHVATRFCCLSIPVMTPSRANISNNSLSDLVSPDVIGGTNMRFSSRLDKAGV